MHAWREMVLPILQVRTLCCHLFYPVKYLKACNVIPLWRATCSCHGKKPSSLRVAGVPRARAATVLCAACQVYTESTDGSNVEAKESALVWHYRDADPDFGHWQVPPWASG